MKLRNKNLKPDVRSYTDVKEYLLAYYTWRKASEPRFSYSTWATELGIKSRSYLRLLLIGKRTITERLIPVFVEGLKLNQSCAKYFECLVRYKISTSVEQQNKLLKELRRLGQAPIELTRVADARTFLSSPLYAKLQVLISDEYIERSAAALSEFLQVGVSQTKEALEALVRLNLAEKFYSPDGNEFWRAKTELFDVHDSSDDEALREFHRRSLSEALKAVELPRSQRKFDSLFLILGDEEYEQMLSEISEIIESFLSKFQGRAAGNVKLYQMNINLVPVSEPFLHLETRVVPEGISKTQDSETDLKNEEVLR